jgi:deoxyhypusine synthase
MKTLLKYNKMQNVSDTLENVKESEESMETQGGLLDIIGEWFQEGYKALRFTKASIDTIDEMQNNAVQDLELGEAGNIISVGMGLLIFIVIVVGIIIAMVLKRDT